MQFFQEVVEKHKKIKLLNFGRLPVCQFSLDLKNQIWATFTYYPSNQNAHLGYALKNAHPMRIFKIKMRMKK